MSASLDRLKADVANTVTVLADVSAKLKTAATGTADVDLDALSTQLEGAISSLNTVATPAPTGSTGAGSTS